MAALALAGSDALGASEGMPSALRAMLEARRAVVCGMVEWEVLPGGDEDRAVRYISRYARNGDLAFENRGDREGWTEVDTVTGQGVSRYPRVYLLNADGFWVWRETVPNAMLWRGATNPQAADVLDVRGVGLSVTSRTLRHRVGLTAWPNSEDPIVAWRQERVGDLFVVTGTTREGAQVTWHIHPDKGWNAERVLYDYHGYLAEVTCRLKRFGDVWLPETADYVLNGKPVESVRIRSASLNEPRGPQRLTPSELGLEPGTAVAAQDFDPGAPIRWNGESICTDAEWREDVRAGRRQWGPILARIMRGEEYRSVYATEEEMQRRRIFLRRAAARHELHMESGGLWRQYVEDFIRRYELTPAQADEARQILERCEKEGARIVEKIRPELEALVLQRLNARAAGDEQAMQEANDRIAELRQPLDRIFEEDLKPRLERLPTRAQRKKAEASAAATQPASGPGP